MIELTDEQLQAFGKDGFLVLHDVLSNFEIDAARERFEPLFRGEFTTGLRPDEWNWGAGRDDPSLTRQICNGWKSDPIIQSIVLREDVGRACAQLANWRGGAHQSG
jgi:hypothetical protein